MSAVEKFRTPQSVTAEQQHSMLQELRRPFTAAAVRFKPQTWNPQRNGGIAICYVDARLVVERLNRVVGLDWHDEYERLDSTTMLCRLTVCGTTRQDVGIAESSAAGGLKALYSDSLKRAAVRFGVGVSLYAVPQLRIDANDVWIKQKDGKPGGLTDSGMVKLRRLYEQWLSRQGSAFGDPLDHGDELDSIGEVADAPTEPEVVEPVASGIVNGQAYAETPQGETVGADKIVAHQLAAIGKDGRKRLKELLVAFGMIKKDEQSAAVWHDVIINNFGTKSSVTGEPMYADLRLVIAGLEEQARLRDAATPLSRQDASDRLYEDESERMAAAAGLPMYGEGAPS